MKSVARVLIHKTGLLSPLNSTIKWLSMNGDNINKSSPEINFTVTKPTKKKIVKRWYCRDRVSSCNIYAVQQDTQSVLMSKFIEHLC